MKGLLFLLYDLLFTIGFIIYLPFYFLRKKITISSLKERLGFFPFFSKKSIWIHAVSVGEVNLIEPVVKRLREVLDYPIVISTTTLTGNQVARKKYSKTAKVIYFPLDLSFVLTRFLRKINPNIVIAAETELWPNLIWRLNKKNIPFVIINGRISNQAFRRYKNVRGLTKKVLSGCRRIGAQSSQDKRRFLYLGADQRRVSITGNLKFNIITPGIEKIEKFKKKFIPILKPNSKTLFTAASTHQPEEEIILGIYKQIYLKENLNLLIAPRHPGRAPWLENLIADYGFNPVPVSKIDQKIKEKNNIFILDTVGELIYFYSISDLCFVGGSLSSSGGHNILEPIYFLKPVLFGPNMENFAHIAKIALSYKAAIQVDDSSQLKDKLLFLLKNKEKWHCYTEACMNVFKENNSLPQSLRIILDEINA